MKLRPLLDRVIIKQSESESTSGGIIIPDAAQQKPSKGTVVAVGPGGLDSNGETIAMSVAVDDVVLFGKYSAVEIQVNGDTFIVVSEREIFGVVE